jgi:integrase
VLQLPGGLSPRSTNMCLACLSRIMRTAERHRIIDRDPAAGFRVRGASKRTAHLETAEQIVALLNAADELDEARRGRRGHGRALLATLLYGGLRIDEAPSLRWRDVDLAVGILRIRASKTDAGERRIEVLAPLRDDLLAVKARRDEPRDALVFGTSRGGKDSDSNVRRRLLALAVERATSRSKARARSSSPTLTPHGLRHTCASLLAVCDWHPHRAMTHMGHADARFTPNAYTKAMARTEGEREALRALVEGRPLVGDNALAQERTTSSP